MVNGQCFTTMMTTSWWSSGQDMGFGGLGMANSKFFSWNHLDIPVFCWYFNNIASIPLLGIFTQDVLTWIWQYSVRSRFNHVYANPEHMSVFMSWDTLPIYSVLPPLGTNTWYDDVMVFAPWKTSYHALAWGDILPLSLNIRTWSQQFCSRLAQS